MQAPEISDVVKGIAQKVCDSLAAALAASCDTNWQVKVSDPANGTTPDPGSSASFRYIFEGGCTGQAILAFPVWALSKLSLRDLPEHERESQSAQTGKLLNAMQQGVAGLAASADEEGATSVRIEGVEDLAITDEYVIELWIQSDPHNADTRVPLQFCVGQKLIAALQAMSAKPFLFPDAAASDPSNLDLVMDVELNVTLRFGQRQLALREVLELTSGSVVELDRQVDEPVELILDGRVVARGEAVIIDGNYGMRITQLVQNVLP